MKKLIKITVHALCALCLAAPGWTEQRELKTDAAEQIDAILVLDASGSMLVTDPLRMRDEGARLFLQFLKSGDRLGIIQFAEQASVVRPLTPFSSDQVDAVSRQVGSIGATGQYTDLLAGVKAAQEVLSKDPSKDRKPVIILLSDGKMDPDPAEGTASDLTRSLVEEVIPELKSKGMCVYTLAFSEQADRDLLKQMAAASDGVSWFTPSVEKIHESYADLFLSVKKPQVIPLSGRGFPIDAEVQEATFYINREQNSNLELKSPTGAIYTSETGDEKVKWFRGQKFDVITIYAPEVGNWQVLGISQQDGFATILTNLKLVSDWPVSLVAGSPELLQGRLYEGKKPIDLPEMAQVVRYAFQITPTDRVSEPIIREFMVDDGSSGDKIAKDGIFSFRVKLDEPGEYRLRILAKAPTFERQQQIPFRVRPALISLLAHNPEEQAEEGKEAETHEKEPDAQPSAAASDHVIAKGTEETLFEIELSDDARLLRNIQVKLTAVDLARNRYILPVAPSLESASRYEAAAASLPVDGKYELQATLNANDAKGKTVKETSRIVEFTRQTRGSKPVEKAVVVVTPKKKDQAPWFPLTGVLIVSAVNVLAGFAAISVLRKSQGKMVLDLPDFQIPANVLSAMDELEKKMALTEVDLNSDLFNEEEAPPQNAEPVEPPAEPAPEAAPEAEAER